MPTTQNLAPPAGFFVAKKKNSSPEGIPRAVPKEGMPGEKQD